MICNQLKNQAWMIWKPCRFWLFDKFRGLISLIFLVARELDAVSSILAFRALDASIVDDSNWRDSVDESDDGDDDDEHLHWTVIVPSEHSRKFVHQVLDCSVANT